MTDWNPQCHRCHITWDEQFDFGLVPDEPGRLGWDIDPTGTATCSDCEWAPKETK